MLSMKLVKLLKHTSMKFRLIGWTRIGFVNMPSDRPTMITILLIIVIIGKKRVSLLEIPKFNRIKHDNVQYT